MASALEDLVRTKRWNDPREVDDGYRLLVTRLRPRGVARAAETWDAWCEHLGPSRELLFAFKGKNGPPIPWDEYARRYRAEMAERGFWLRGYAAMITRGERLTLLCASTCLETSRCHRTLLRELLLEAARPAEVTSRPAVIRRGRD